MGNHRACLNCHAWVDVFKVRAQLSEEKITYSSSLTWKVAHISNKTHLNTWWLVFTTVRKMQVDILPFAWLYDSQLMLTCIPLTDSFTALFLSVLHVCVFVCVSKRACVSCSECKCAFVPSTWHVRSLWPAFGVLSALMLRLINLSTPLWHVAVCSEVSQHMRWQTEHTGQQDGGRMGKRYVPKLYLEEHRAVDIKCPVA